MMRGKALACSAGALLFVPACTELVEDEPTPCANDWDCSIGEVCGSDSAVCETAAPGDERDFGQVEMSFTTGDETYLLAVFDVPTTAEVADGLVTFSLSAGGAPGGALRLRPAKRAATFEPDRAAWDARLAFEGQRRAGIAQLIDGVRAGKRSLYGLGAPKAASCTASADCDDPAICWQGECTDQPVLKLIQTHADTTFTSVGVAAGTSLEVNVLVDNADVSSAQTACEEAAAAAATALENALDLFGLSGHTGALDRDGDGRLTIAFTSSMPSGIVGAFDYPDFLPASDGSASGNQADILWAATPTDVSPCAAPCVTPELAIGTLAHEYTHLIQFAERIYGAGGNPADNEVLWLDEAMAHLMEDMTGYGASNVGNTAAALDNWGAFGLATSTDTDEQRGRGYLLLRYLVDRNSTASTAVAANSYGLHGILLGESALGYEHTVFENLGADGMWDWLLATYATNNPDVTQAEANHPYLPTGSAATGQTTGFDPFGTFETARGEDIEFAGPALGDGNTDLLEEFSSPYESELIASGAVLFLVTGLEPGTAVIVGSGDAQSDLHLRAERIY